jgi:hypothetical protein
MKRGEFSKTSREQNLSSLRMEGSSTTYHCVIFDFRDFFKEDWLAVE